MERPAAVRTFGSLSPLSEDIDYHIVSASCCRQYYLSNAVPRRQIFTNPLEMEIIYSKTIISRYKSKAFINPNPDFLTVNHQQTDCDTRTIDFLLQRLPDPSP